MVLSDKHNNQDKETPSSAQDNGQNIPSSPPHKHQDQLNIPSSPPHKHQDELHSEGHEDVEDTRDSQGQSCTREVAKTESNQVKQTNEDTGNKSAQAKKPRSAAEKKYGYRLTPDEQELAYELKASMMRKLENQNANLETELNAHKNMTSLRRKQQQRPYSSRLATGNGISQHNMKLLMKSYEKKAKDAEERIKQMEDELQESRDLAKRYQAMYISEKEKSGKAHGKQDTDSPGRSENSKSEEKDSDSKNSTPKTDRSKSAQGRKGSPEKEDKTTDKRKAKEKDEKVTDDALEDDEAVYKRHIARIADTKAMGTTSPIRVQDVIRKSEVLIEENEALKREVTRLKWDNGQLVKKVKQSSTDKDQLLHMINTGEAARRDLGKRLQKETQKNQKLSKSLTRQTSDWIQFRKDLHEVDDRRRMAMLAPMAPGDIDAQQRTFTHPAKKNVYMPRYMYPVEQYSQTQKST